MSHVATEYGQKMSPTRAATAVTKWCADSNLTMRTTGEVVEEALSFSAEAALAEVAEALAEVASEEVWAVAEEPARGSDPSFS